MSMSTSASTSPPKIRSALGLHALTSLKPPVGVASYQFGDQPWIDVQTNQLVPGTGRMSLHSDFAKTGRSEPHLYLSLGRASDSDGKTFRKVFLDHQAEHSGYGYNAGLQALMYRLGADDIPKDMQAVLGNVVSWTDTIARMQPSTKKSLYTDGVQTLLAANSLNALIKSQGQKAQFPVKVIGVGEQDLAILTERYEGDTKFEVNSSYSTAVPRSLCRIAPSKGVTSDDTSYAVLDISSPSPSTVDFTKSFLCRPEDATAAGRLPQSVLDTYLGKREYSEHMQGAVQRGVKAWQEATKNRYSWDCDPDRPVALMAARTRGAFSMSVDDFILTSCQMALTAAAPTDGSDMTQLQLTSTKRYNSLGWEHKADDTNKTGFLDEEHLNSSVDSATANSQIAAQWIKFQDHLDSEAYKLRDAEERRLKEDLKLSRLTESVLRAENFGLSSENQELAKDLKTKKSHAKMTSRALRLFEK